MFTFYGNQYHDYINVVYSGSRQCIPSSSVCRLLCSHLSQHQGIHAHSPIFICGLFYPRSSIHYPPSSILYPHVSRGRFHFTVIFGPSKDHLKTGHRHILECRVSGRAYVIWRQTFYRLPVSLWGRWHLCRLPLYDRSPKSIRIYLYIFAYPNVALININSTFLIP